MKLENKNKKEKREKQRLLCRNKEVWVLNESINKGTIQMLNLNNLNFKHKAIHSQLNQYL